MQIVYDYPPMWAEIDAKFKLRHSSFRPVFAWGRTIYNPFRNSLPKHIILHEAEHGARQIAGVGVERWWVRYIEDDQFRLDEELIAHHVEYRALLLELGSNRNARRQAITITARRLANPLYQYNLSTDEARRLLKNAEAHTQTTAPL